MIEALVRGAPDDVALIRADGTEQTYAQLHAAWAQAAVALRALDVGPGRIVAVAVADPAGFIVTALAVWSCGAAVLPIDARAGRQAIARCSERVRAVATIVDASLDGELGFAAPTEGGAVVDRDSADPRARCDSCDPRAALVLLTSGSSAEPKAVLLRAEGLVANVEGILDYLPIASAPRTAVVVPLSYSYGLVGQVLTTLRAGGSLLLLSNVAYPAVQIEAMRCLGAQGLSSVPTSLRALARAAVDLPPDARPSLAYVASAGAPLDAATTAMVRAAFPGARLFNQYGLTEASPRVTALSDDEPAFARGSVGRPLRGVEVWAIAPDGARLPADVEGELVVRGPSVMLGYLDDREATEQVLSADGALRTADAGRVDASGYVYVSGRLDGVVKCAGERVNVEEIAATLRGCAGVRDAYVVAVADVERGAALHAFVEAHAEMLPAIRAFVRANLAPAKRPVRIVALEALPRTSNGKVARASLPSIEEPE